MIRLIVLILWAIAALFLALIIIELVAGMELILIGLGVLACWYLIRRYRKSRQQ